MNSSLFTESRPGAFFSDSLKRPDRHLVGGHGALGFLGHSAEAMAIALIVLFAVLLGFARNIGVSAPWKRCARWRACGSGST
jgi:hypothetical protein